MTSPGRDDHDDALEPTIRPVRRPVAEPGPSETGRTGRRLRGLALGAAAVLVLAGLVAVFVLLPERVEEAARQAQTEAEAEPEVEAQAPPAEPPLSAAEIAALTEEAESLLAELLEQQQDLTARSGESWGDTTWSAYQNAARAADDAFLAGELREAVRQYEAALAIGTELLDRSRSLIAEALDAGYAALMSGNAELAVSQFELVLAIDPDNARALSGRARAGTLPAVLAAMRRGDAAVEAGDIDGAAAAYREALVIDPEHSVAREALATMTSRIATARYNRFITEGYLAIEERRYDDAIERFESALAERPDSAAASDGLAQAEQGRQLSAIAMAEIRGAAFERRELWGEAIARYREALASDPTLAFAIEGLERAQRREDLDTKLETLINEPRRLLTESVLEDARELLATARAVEAPGVRLAGQIERLDELIRLASTPIKLTLISDNATEVSVYRYGELGRFTSQEIELKPGSYTAVGQREGYRDVRETFSVLPGVDNGPVTVICTEQIQTGR